MQAAFVSINDRRLLHVCWAAPGTPQDPPVLLLPSLFEELNRGRAILARLARRLAHAGRTVHVLDAYGTGDSEGVLADASLTLWQDDLRQFCETMLPRGPIDVLAVRAGALMLSDASSPFPPERIRQLVLLQPVLAGARFMTQLLRTRVASARFQGREETIEGLRRLVAERGSIEVAGYEIGARLLAELDAASPQLPPPGQRLTVLEVGAAEAPAPPPVVQFLARASDTGWDTAYLSVRDLRFWASQELCQADTLIDALFQTLTAETGR